MTELTRKPIAARIIRICMVVLLILILRRFPGRLLFVLVQGGGALFIILGALYLWHRLSKRLSLKRASRLSKLLGK